MNLEEVKRKKSQYESILILSYLALFIGFIIFFLNPYFGFLFFVTGMVLSIVPMKRFKSLSTTFKSQYVKDILEKLIPDSSYDPLSGFEKDIVYGSLILKREDRYHSEDLITGTIQGKHFSCADVHLQDVRSNGKSTTVVTVFHGLFFMIDAAKPFQHDTYIMPNHMFLFGTMNGLKKLDMEYIEFNQTFDVFGSDEMDTFALIKPRFMEEILDFQKDNKKIRLGFQKDKIYVAIDKRKDTFDLKAFRPIDETFFNEINGDIKLIQELLSLIN